jgi:Putative zinc-binding metallo-peptidase
MNDLEDAREIMMYMRHEAGHAFNYAYQLYKSAEWRDLFGPFRRAYRDNYRPIPFSRKYVRHMAGWYAQKHPDEDFSETFAVWLTPRSQWRKRYEGWDAIKKLQYVDRIARKFGDAEPIRRRGFTDITVDEMESTVGEFYRLSLPDEVPVQDLTLDTDLADIFNISPKRRKGVRPAQELLHQHRKPIIDKVAYWSGVQRPIVKRLVEALCKRVEDLGLRVDIRRESDYLTEFTVYTTALSMNYLVRGKFIYP